MTENLSSDSMEILSQVLEEMKREKGSDFILREVNLSELVRRTGISRKKLRNLKKNDFKEKPKGRKGTKNKTTVLSGFTGVIDDYLRKDVANSEVIYDRLQEMGYQGGKTQIKVYIAAHKGAFINRFQNDILTYARFGIRLGIAFVAVGAYQFPEIHLQSTSICSASMIIFRLGMTKA